MNALAGLANLQNRFAAHVRPKRQTQTGSRKLFGYFQSIVRWCKLPIRGLPMDRRIVVLSRVDILCGQRQSQFVADQSELFRVDRQRKIFVRRAISRQHFLETDSRQFA